MRNIRFQYSNLVRRTSALLFAGSVVYGANGEESALPLTNSVRHLPNISHYREIHLPRADQQILDLSEKAESLIVGIRTALDRAAATTDPIQQARYKAEAAELQTGLQWVTSQLRVISANARVLKATRPPGEYGDPISDVVLEKQAALEVATQAQIDLAERVKTDKAEEAAALKRLKEIESENTTLSGEIAEYKTPSQQAIVEYLARRNGAIYTARRSVDLQGKIDLQKAALKKLEMIRDKKLADVSKEIDNLTVASLKNKSKAVLAKEGFGIIETIHKEINNRPEVIDEIASIRAEYAEAAQKITAKIAQLSTERGLKSAQLKIAQENLESMANDGAFNKLLDEKSLLSLYNKAAAISSYIPAHAERVGRKQSELHKAELDARIPLEFR